MPRSFAPVALVLALSVTLLAAPGVIAQEAAPGATPQAMAGITVEPVGLLEVLPGLAVPVVRIELAPGTALSPHTSPGPVVAQVESGQVAFAVVTGVANRARLVAVPGATPMAGTPPAMPPVSGTPGADSDSVTEAVAPFAVVEAQQFILGQETALIAGEGVAFGPDVVHSFRNMGTEPAVIILAGDIPSDQPVIRFVEGGAAATPMPGAGIATPTS